MAEQGTIARPYAQAAFEIARADGQLAAWSGILQMAASIAASPDVTRQMSFPGADLRALASAMADICREKLGAPAPLAAARPAENFLLLLAENQRLGALPAIAERFEELKAAEEKAVDVVLTTAEPLNDAQQARFVESLTKRFGRQVRLAVQVDQALIGGARLQVGDRVIDGTIRTGLDKLATTLRA